MLVLSRKENQRIVFPNLDIAVEILRVSGNAVRVGIEAPREVQVVRPEVHNNSTQTLPSLGGRAARHELRNRLNAANLALHLMQRQIDAGRMSDAEETLQRALGNLDALEAIAAGISFSRTQAECPTCRVKALLVDDDANERELLAGLLRMNGYEVDVVEDGLAALTYLAEQSRPDCVLLDMQMPRMDGRTTVAAIRENPHLKDMKLFAVTGLDREASGVSMGDGGVDGWFVKPLRPTEFVYALAAELCPQTTMV
ncbi:hypothetical protein AYO47_02910 [Planctomyces sp. SCGC AG-212-M04]|nr:hypothetical protein AYO47_02910 [Planctomyces sp. SCGC AG-212-M04]